jgi:disulfide bond formation protein DsbB
LKSEPRTGPDLILATKPFAKDSSLKSWWHVLSTALLLLAALAALAGAAIAFFHVGVEQGWWEGTAACGSALGQGLSAEERLRRILAAPVVRCTDIPWSMLGISMAGWNGIVALGGGGLALRAALRQVLGAKR